MVCLKGGLIHTQKTKAFMSGQIYKNERSAAGGGVSQSCRRLLMPSAMSSFCWKAATLSLWTGQ